YDEQKRRLGDLFDLVSRRLLLQTIDVRWKEHLEIIDKLKEGIHLRSFAQKDPLIEYKKEAFSLFEAVNRNIQAEFLEKLLKIQIVARESVDRLHQQREFDDSSFDYQGAEDSPAPNYAPPVGARPPASGGASLLGMRE